MPNPTALKECAFPNRVSRGERVDLPSETMEWMAEIDFHPEDRERFESLLLKAHEGPLTEDESEEINDFCVVDRFLEKLRNAARTAVGK